MNIAVTGAAGSVGREAIRAFDDHDVTPVTHREHDDIESTVVEIEDRAAVADVVDGHDVVVHLAANPSPGADWDDLLGPNVEGTYNVYAAALESGVERVVFASTNHVHQSHLYGGRHDVESLPDDPDPISADDPFRPDSFYGVSKITGEALGTYHADENDIDVVNLRIGWLLSREELRERQAEGGKVAQFARAIWLSPDDCRRGIRKAATEPLTDNPVDANLVSNNRENYFSLVEARCGFDYHPQDDASEVVADD
ncbi:NAD-dependent epimerase/dehydratase family protein [Halosimplex amylolyticum]|uniref:NAD-dependent epimerase/dehydratase family protein n=1 Tax=Halosimplex amylolyticum TaxID=3396616 RepID=UPI003F561FB1